MNSDTPLTNYLRRSMEGSISAETNDALDFAGELERKLTIARDALRLYEYTVVVGGRYAALEALEATKP